MSPAKVSVDSKPSCPAELYVRLALASASRDSIVPPRAILRVIERQLKERVGGCVGASVSVAGCGCLEMPRVGLEACPNILQVQRAMHFALCCSHNL